MKIGIIGAMEEEVKILREQLGQPLIMGKEQALCLSRAH